MKETYKAEYNRLIREARTSKKKADRMVRDQSEIIKREATAYARPLLDRMRDKYLDEKEELKENIDEILYLKKNIIYIFYYKVEEIGFCKIYFYNLLPEDINITFDEQTIFYLEPSKTYKLNFSESTLPFIIRLNEKIDTKIKIVDNSGKEQSLSSSNKYFYPSSQFYNRSYDI